MSQYFVATTVRKLHSLSRPSWAAPPSRELVRAAESERRPAEFPSQRTPRACGLRHDSAAFSSSLRLLTDLWAVVGPPEPGRAARTCAPAPPQHDSVSAPPHSEAFGCRTTCASQAIACSLARSPSACAIPVNLTPVASVVVVDVGKANSRHKHASRPIKLSLLSQSASVDVSSGIIIIIISQSGQIQLSIA